MSTMQPIFQASTIIIDGLHAIPSMMARQTVHPVMSRHNDVPSRVCPPSVCRAHALPRYAVMHAFLLSSIVSMLWLRSLPSAFPPFSSAHNGPASRFPRCAQLGTVLIPPPSAPRRSHHIFAQQGAISAPQLSTSPRRTSAYLPMIVLCPPFSKPCPCVRPPTAATGVCCPVATLVMTSPRIDFAGARAPRVGQRS
ncbi:hypothetical protein DAEQUDRAFT_243480 [Daedalea quercina L-15889]|uniref:Uncharacterized protein n=1 Tax=Daedalea quercina L-15889 TaxID=1314783 RepID=A0A165QSI6_9APHY|nr:hypothetical protein DAEQUDRAFT_243480 [Daedalea quercina L-15889]